MKWPRREADRSIPSIHSPVRLHGVVLIWAQGQLYFTLLYFILPNLTLPYLTCTYFMSLLSFMSQDSPIIKATVYGLEDRGSVPDKRRCFSSPPHPDRFWAILASFPIHTGGFIPNNKATEAWSFTSTQCWGQGHSPIQVHGTMLNHRDSFTFTFTLVIHYLVKTLRRDSYREHSFSMHQTTSQ